MKKICCVIFCALALATVRGAEQQFANQNIAITVPDGWQPFNGPHPPDLMGLYFSPDKQSLLMVSVGGEQGQPGVVNDQFIANFDKGLENGGHKISGKYVEIAGVKGYERYGDVMKDGKNGTIFTHLLIADGKLYTVSGMRADGDVMQQQDVLKAVNSFRFLHPPKAAPQSGAEPSATPIPPVWPTSGVRGLIYGFVNTSAFPLLYALAAAIVVMAFVFPRKQEAAGGSEQGE